MNTLFTCTGDYYDVDLKSTSASPKPRRGRPRVRSRPPLKSQSQVIGSPNPSPSPSRSNSREPLYRATSLETRSRTPSPHPTPTPGSQQEYYGSFNLTDRSRSPSPSSTSGHGPSSRKKDRSGRKLPVPPQKPSSLNLPKTQPEAHMPHVLPSPTIQQPHKSPGSINFPRLNASPTHNRINIPPSSTENVRRDHHHTSAVRPRPSHSPTDKNDLNMPPSQSRERLALSPTALRPRNSRYSGQVLNNGNPADPRYVDKSRDNQFGGNRFEMEEARRGQGAGRQSGVVLPNGYKPGQRSDRAAQLHASVPGRPASHQRTSDSDDEDWC